jgi:hypothetical protein
MSWIDTQLEQFKLEVTWLLGERDVLLGERDVLLGERDVLLGERDVLLGERDALLSSATWRYTAFVRRIVKIFRA